MLPSEKARDNAISVLKTLRALSLKQTFIQMDFLAVGLLGREEEDGEGNCEQRSNENAFHRSLLTSQLVCGCTLVATLTTRARSSGGRETIHGTIDTAWWLWEGKATAPAPAAPTAPAAAVLGDLRVRSHQSPATAAAAAVPAALAPPRCCCGPLPSPAPLPADWTPPQPLPTDRAPLRRRAAPTARCA